MHHHLAYVLVYPIGNRRGCLGEDLPHKGVSRTFQRTWRGDVHGSWAMYQLHGTASGVIGESYEATEAGDLKDPLHPLPSVHVAEE